MNLSDKRALIEFLKGGSFVLLVMGIVCGFVGMLGGFKIEPVEKFSVVDHYGTCAVVRYSRQEEGRYTYFLDCGNQHLEQVR